MAYSEFENDYKVAINNILKDLYKDTEYWGVGPAGNQGMQDFINLKLHIESKSGITIEQIVAKLKYWKYKHNIQVAIIDFLQSIGYSEERMRYHTDLENMNYTLDRISHTAKELDIPIILLSQLNRDLYKRGGNKEPDLADLKGSGKIEEIAYQISFYTGRSITEF